MLTEIIILFILFLINGLFVMSEIALMGNGANAEPGKVLDYDAKAGRFKNSAEANKMVLKRAYRPGWELPT